MWAHGSSYIFKGRLEKIMKFWKNTSVTAKLITSFGVLIFLLVGISLYAIGIMKEGDERFNSYIHGIQARVELNNKVRQAANQRAIAARNLVLMSNPADVERQKTIAQTAMGDVHKYLTQLQELSDKTKVAQEVRERIETIRKIESQYAPVALSILESVSGGQRDAAIDKLSNQCVPLLASLIRATDEFNDFSQVQALALIQEIEESNQRQQMALAMGCLSIVMLACWAAFMIIRGGFNPEVQHPRF